MKTKQETKDSIRRLAYYFESYSCSEATLRILSIAYDDLLSPDVLRLGSINRGGACVDGRCGILESTMLFLSYTFGRSTPSEDYSRLAIWIERIHRCFNESMDGYTCREIWYPTDEKINSGEFIPHTHCIIYEGLEAISDVIYDAYIDLNSARNNSNMPYEVDENDKCESLRSDTSDSLSDKVEHYLREGYVCSEVAIRALSDVLNLHWSDSILRIATAYQRGGAFGDRCGVLETVLLILSYKYGRMDSRETNLQDRMLSRRFHESVKKKLGGTNCSELSGAIPGTERVCPVIIDILELAVPFVKNADCIIEKELDSFTV